MSINNLARDLLNAVGQPMLGNDPGPLLRSIDWSEKGVSHPYIIFMTGRCGSTWLTSLLKDTGLVGNPEEFFNADVCRYTRYPKNGLVEYFEHVVSGESSNGRLGIEIDNARLSQLESLIDWASVFPVRATTAFYLYRRDLLAQAWSWVSAKKSGIWHLRLGTQEAMRSEESIPTHAELRREMVQIRRGEEFLEDFYGRHGYGPYRIAYESLVAEQTLTIATMLRMLGIDEKGVGEVAEAGRGSLNRISYSNKQRVLGDFACSHRSVMDALDRNRFGISSKDLAALLERGEPSAGG